MAERGNNGMQRFLPGINILFGLEKESKRTHTANMRYLNEIMRQDLLLRRINIRQVVPYEGTPLYESCRDKYLRKNKKFYWKWRNEIRQKVDHKMLQRTVPEGSVLKDVRMEVYDGNNTFGRQLGTYPLIIGVKQKLKLNDYYDLKITGHMLRSVIAVPL